jgi:hypothetical protein
VKRSESEEEVKEGGVGETEPGPVNGSGKSRKRAVPLPTIMTLTPEMRRWAQTTFGSGPSLQAEFDKFCDYHRAKGSVFRDWDAAWRNWMRNAVRYWQQQQEQEPTRVQPVR